VTVHNTGDQSTDADVYEDDASVYDADGQDVGTGLTGIGRTDTTAVDPGEETTVIVSPGVDGDPARVASYEISLSCEGFDVDGVYCE